MRPAPLLPALTLCLFTSACASVAPALRAEPTPDAALREAAEAFYGAETPAQLEAAAQRAAQHAPDAALTHELLARLAQLHGDEASQLGHLLDALLDVHDDAPVLHLHSVMSLDFSAPERARVMAVLERLAESHPSPEVRALATSHLVGFRHLEGDLAERDALLASLPGRFPLDVIGTWDNDQGKAFDLELGPESAVSLSGSSTVKEVYQGRVGPLEWRLRAPQDPRGRLDLGALMAPTRWAAAFARGTVTAAQAGVYELRLTSSDPLKVWVDGKLVFAAAQLERYAFEHLVVPLQLSAGEHRVLVKLAHRDGAWLLTARLTPAERPYAQVDSVEALLAERARQLPEGEQRAFALRVAWAHFAAGGVPTVRAADAWVKRAPRSIVARAWQVDALWYNQERGRAADAIAALDAELGDALPFIRLRQTRFHQQQGLKQKARAQLLALRTALPKVREVREQLIEVYRAEGWSEDELREEQALRRDFGATPDEDGERARTLLRLGRRDEAVATYEALLRQLPQQADTLKRLSDLALEAGALARAQGLVEERVAAWPVDWSGWMQLGEVKRRAQDRAGADAAFREASALSPESSQPWARRGDLAWESADLATALPLWRRALELNPENEALANRVDFLAPEARGPWMADIPDEAALAKAVKAREHLKAEPGADVAYLLDHEVTLLNTDGSTANVVTMVVHAFNAQGRDRIMRQTVGAGRLRVLFAYAVDEKGQRAEASSERNRQIFFRGMQPGSTLVLQYRLDVPPQGYLARYLTKSWSFQSVGDQRLESRFDLWVPAGTVLHEERVGPLARSEERRGEQLRVEWLNREVHPVVAEPGMPTLGEVATNLRVSTVPDWKTWLSWEQALLEGVFRDSPELDQVARTLGEGAATPQAKLLRVHQFVMEEIRYQQDYESFIAGVKPHAAPVVLERRYGDCKDKAVLFIELARKLGLEAHFALVRTRDQGPATPEVPMQQFNHAIVYVPAQAGVEARFFDPTAELLDLQVVRVDDTGTKSLVFDPTTGVHTWREIPFQAPELNAEASRLSLALDAQGGVKGRLELEAVGRTGSMLRRTAHNSEVLTQLGQRLASSLVPNAAASAVTPEEVKNLEVPARFSLNLEAQGFGRQEGETLRVKVPSEWSPRALFPLATRKLPMLLGAPGRIDTEVRLRLPTGFEVRRLPSAGKVELPCLVVERTAVTEGDAVVARTSYVTRCERLTAAEYAASRARGDDMVKLLDDELVVAPVAAKGRARR
jgi:tetratricopeptide (TPR) repeat protein/transglutaminase-like putative cysteine protease